MELEELTKTQIVLLVLLVSFVTSIATGIVTVSLLAQAPPAAIQTVNQIIERTVTSVAPATSQSAAVVTKETTVVVKEEELVTKSVADSLGRIGRIHADASTSSPIVALGALIQGGTLVADASSIVGTHAVTFGDVAFLYTVSGSIPSISVDFLTASGTPPSVAPFKSADAGSLKLGQTLIAMNGLTSDRIGITSFAGLAPISTISAGDAKVSVRSIATNLSSVPSGTPLITIFGDLAGISTSVSRIDDRGSFIALSDMLAALSALKSATSTSAQ